MTEDHKNWEYVGGGILWHCRFYYNSVRDYILAVHDYPRGVLCGWCGRPNFLYDDCGFFQINPHGNDHRITCERCYRGPLGEAHIARHGLGER